MNFFGVLNRIDGCLFCCEASCATTPTPTPKVDVFGRRVFDVKAGQFLIVVEGKAGPSGVLPADSVMPEPPDGRPDLQIQSTTALGNGSPAICDTGVPPAGGGVPGINPPSYAPLDSRITDALVDFACRFEAFDRGSPCTRSDSTGDSKLADSTSTVQFCNAVASAASFPPGESILTVRLRDREGNVGPTKQIVVRVATPTPTASR